MSTSIYLSLLVNGSSVKGSVKVAPFLGWIEVLGLVSKPTLVEGPIPGKIAVVKKPVDVSSFHIVHALHQGLRVEATVAFVKEGRPPQTWRFEYHFKQAFITAITPDPYENKKLKPVENVEILYHHMQAREIGGTGKPSEIDWKSHWRLVSSTRP